MSRRAAVRQADLTRAIRAALAAGLKEGSFSVEAEDGVVRILTNTADAAVASATQDDEAWGKAMTQWRRSA